MLSAKWIDLKGGGRAKLEPLSGPQVWDLARTGYDGDTIYRVFREAVVEFENIETLDGSQRVSSRDVKPQELGAVVQLLIPSEIYEAVTHAANLAMLTEEQRGNYSSQRTSSATPRSSAADPATAPEGSSPPASDTDSSSSASS